MTPFGPFPRTESASHMMQLFLSIFLVPGITTVSKTASVKMEHVHDCNAFPAQRTPIHPSKPN